jgi:hypothetical protein
MVDLPREGGASVPLTPEPGVGSSESYQFVALDENHVYGLTIGGSLLRLAKSR